MSRIEERPLAERLADFEVDENGCHNWRRTLSRYGYGVIVIAGQRYLVHRMVAARQGWKVKGLCVLHRCDNRKCINPDHLFVGTLADNRRDCVSKGRQARGSRHGNAKLTEGDVREIRSAAGVTQTALAERYCVSPQLIGLIVRRRYWNFT